MNKANNLINNPSLTDVICEVLCETDFESAEGWFVSVLPGFSMFDRVHVYAESGRIMCALWNVADDVLEVEALPC